MKFLTTVGDFNEMTNHQRNFEESLGSVAVVINPEKDSSKESVSGVSYWSRLAKKYPKPISRYERSSNGTRKYFFALDELTQYLVTKPNAITSEGKLVAIDVVVSEGGGRADDNLMPDWLIACLAEATDSKANTELIRSALGENSSVTKNNYTSNVEPNEVNREHNAEIKSEFPGVDVEPPSNALLGRHCLTTYPGETTLAAARDETNIKDRGGSPENAGDELIEIAQAKNTESCGTGGVQRATEREHDENRGTPRKIEDEQRESESGRCEIEDELRESKGGPCESEDEQRESEVDQCGSEDEQRESESGRCEIEDELRESKGGPCESEDEQRESEVDQCGSEDEQRESEFGQCESEDDQLKTAGDACESGQDESGNQSEVGDCEEAPRETEVPEDRNAPGENNNQELPDGGSQTSSVRSNIPKSLFLLLVEKINPIVLSRVNPNLGANWIKFMARTDRIDDHRLNILAHPAWLQVGRQWAKFRSEANEALKFDEFASDKLVVDVGAVT